MFKRLILIMLLGLALGLPAQAGQDIYGPIGRQDTLWKIAEQLTPSKKVTTQQVIMALYKKNQHAFTVNNINSLRKDAYMLAPTATEVHAIAHKTAIQMVKRHNTRWKKGRYVRINTKPPAELQKKLIAQSQPANTQADTTATKTTAAATQTSENTQLLPPQPQKLGLGKLPVPQQLKVLKHELAKAREENALLQNELTILKQKKTASAQINPQIQAQLDALRHELTELRTILSQKDNHIKTLQASLKDASRAIKSQHADNMRLYNKLKELSPESVPSQQAATSGTTAQLTLAEVNAVPAATNNPNNTSIPKVWADEVRKNPTTQSDKPTGTGQGVLLSEIVNHQAQMEKQAAVINNQSNRSTVSPVAWTAVLLSFAFIIFMIVRALMMQSDIRRFEEEDDFDLKSMT